MKTFLKILIPISLILGIVACEESSSTSSLSSVAQITAFAFTANDSFPGLAAAQFIVLQESDTGIIRMRKNDSVAYGTPIDSIIPNITYYTTPSAVTFYLGDSAVSLTGTDTLDLTIKPIKIHVIAQNTDYDKWYKLEFDVHKVDGEHFTWSTPQYIAGAFNAGVQKALMFKDTICYFQATDKNIMVHKATVSRSAIDSTLTWQSFAVEGLPKDCNVRQIVEGEKNLFYGKGHHIYTSVNGYQWTDNEVPNLDIVALYMCLNVKNIYEESDSLRIWMAARDENNCMRFVTIGTNLIPHVESHIGLKGDSLPLSFPIEDYATIPFQSSSLHQHAMIAGGYDRLGRMTDARWSLEYNFIYDEYHLTNMALGNSSMAAFAGSTISYYGDFMYLLGGVTGADRQFITNAYTSIDEGVHWTEVTDSINPKRPTDFTGRNRVNSFVHEELNEQGDTLHYIYIIGGEDHSTTYSDIHRGYLISVDWPAIGD